MVNILAQHQGLGSAWKPAVKRTDWQYNNTACATNGLRQQRAASAVQHNVQQLPETFHGSGALPNQGHLQATAVNNRQRT